MKPATNVAECSASVRGVTCRAGGARAVNPPVRQVPDPPVDRRPRHHHLLAGRPRMCLHPPARGPACPAAACSAPDRRPRGSAGTGTRPPARRGPRDGGPPQPLTSITSSVKTVKTAVTKDPGSPRRRPEPARVGHPRPGRSQQQPARHRRGQPPPRHRAHPPALRPPPRRTPRPPPPHPPPRSRQGPAAAGPSPSWPPAW